MEKEKTVTDFSNIDLENFLDKSEEELKGAGFKESEEYLGYGALEGDVQISVTDGEIDFIIITGENDKAPSFHGVKLGMSEEEAYEKLRIDYEEIGGVEGNMFINIETKGSVNCKVTGGKISTIMYMTLSEDEITAYQQAKEADETEYIFPDSDSKYLSEDEVRGVEVEKLAIGRNEIFARHGYIFKDEALREYFENTSWYEGTIQAEQFNSDSIFNDFEKKNVELIKRIEEEISGSSVPQKFIGMAGVYICTTPRTDDFTGKISILSVGDSSIQYSIGALEMPSDIVTGEAQIMGNNTAQTDLYGYIITFTWSDAENMYVTGSGELYGMDSGTIMEVTGGMGYTRPLEFNQ